MGAQAMRMQAGEPETGPLDEARGLLTRWGAWMRSVAGARLGYPARAAFAPVAPGGMGHAIEDEAAQAVDRSLAALKRVNGQAYRALEHWYCWECSVLEAAGRMGCSPKTFKVHRQLGEHFLAGCLERSQTPHVSKNP